MGSDHSKWSLLADDNIQTGWGISDQKEMAEENKPYLHLIQHRGSGWRGLLGQVQGGMGTDPILMGTTLGFDSHLCPHI